MTTMKVIPVKKEQFTTLLSEIISRETDSATWPAEMIDDAAEWCEAEFSEKWPWMAREALRRAFDNRCESLIANRYGVDKMNDLNQEDTLPF